MGRGPSGTSAEPIQQQYNSANDVEGNMFGRRKTGFGIGTANIQNMNRAAGMVQSNKIQTHRSDPPYNNMSM
jgi:hypothetical protein